MRNEIHKPYYIAVVGIDGSGKSTATQMVIDSIEHKKILGVGDALFVKNPDGPISKLERARSVRSWHFFWSMAKKTKNKALYKPVKLLELIFRSKVQNRAVKDMAPHVVVSDGTMLVNIIAWGNIYHPDIFTNELCLDALGQFSGIRPMSFKKKIIYLFRAFDLFLMSVCRVRFPLPDHIIFLTIRPSVAIERIKSRGKKLQFHENTERLEMLQRGYERINNLISKELDVRVTTIEVSDMTLAQEKDQIKEVVLKII